MNDELQRHLDGEAPADALGPGERAEAAQWDRMIASFRRDAPTGSAPPWLEQRVMGEIESLPERGSLGRALDWLLSPATVRVSPLTAGLVTAALAALLIVPRVGAPPGGEGSPTAGGVGADAVVYVQFLLEAPTATSVAVAGDFNEWQPSGALEDPDGDGVWSGRVPVSPGVHGYMFLIDDTRWQTDPNAERYRDDGFGNRNAVLAVGASS